MVWVPLGQVALGVALLVIGAEAVVRGGSALAARVGLSRLWIGLTVVAIGTSAPELVVSATAAAQGVGDVAVGNVVGSNILNILVVLGATAVVLPVAVQARTVQRDIPLVTAVGILILLFGRTGHIPRWGGLVLLGLAVAYLAYLHHRERAPIETQARVPWQDGNPWLLLAVTLLGIGLLLGGGRLILEGALDLADRLGLDERVVALTVVALGTSLPELAVSLAAAVRKQMDIAVGNLVGSNMLNMTLVLGASATISPLPVAPEMLRLDLPFMLLVGLLLWQVAFTGLRVSRVEGILLLVAYVGYVYVLLARPPWPWL